MPITPVPPEIQALLNPQPTLGRAFDAMVGSAKQEGLREQESQRTLFEGLSRQTPGFAEYVIANHPDLIQSMTAAPRIFRGKGETEFGARLQEAMTAFRSQPPPAEAPVSGAESATITREVRAVLEKDPNFRKMPPEQQGQAFGLLDHMSRATNSDDRQRAFVGLQTLLGKEPTEEQQKFAAALDILGDPALGYTDEEKAATAAGYAVGKTIDPADKRLFDAQMRVKDAKLRDLEIAGKTLDNAQKENEAAHGKAIPQHFLDAQSNLLYVSRRMMRAYEVIDKFGWGESAMGNLMHAPAYSVAAAEAAALLNDLGEDQVRFPKDLRGRVSAQLLDLLKPSLVSYDKTPTQLRGIVKTAIQNLLDQQGSQLDVLRAAGVGSDAYYDKIDAFLQPLADLAVKIQKDTEAHKTAPKPTIMQRIFGGGPTPPGPGAQTPTPEDILFHQPEEGAQ